MAGARREDDVVRIWLFLCALVAPTNVAAQSQDALVMSLIFDECLGYVQEGNAPFTDYALQPARLSPARLEGTAQAASMFDGAYEARWGTDPELDMAFCIVDRKDTAQAALGVIREGFLTQLDERATAHGLVNEDPAPKLSTEFWNVWQRPGQTRGLQIVFAVTGAEGPIAELGVFSVSVPIEDRLSDVGTGGSLLVGSG